MRIGIGTSIVGQQVAGEAPFDPASLFSGGEDGAWYDPSDLSTLAQNSDGTGTVTVGDPVGYMADKSGNGLHATQATAGHRPTLRESGGLYYLEFDGVDDYMQSAATGWGASQTAWISAAANSSNASTATRCVIAAVSDGSYTNSRDWILLEINNSGNNRWIAETLETTADVVTSLSPDITDINVLTGYNDGINAVLRRNGSGVASSTTNITSDYLTLSQEIDIGALDQLGSILVNSPLNLYGLILRLDPPSVDDLANMESYLAGKSGVTL